MVDIVENQELKKGKLESADEVKDLVLGFMASMGNTSWSSEINKIKKEQLGSAREKWVIQITKKNPERKIDLEIEAATGKIILYELR